MQGAAGDVGAACVGIDVRQDDGAAIAGTIADLVDRRRDRGAGHVADDGGDRAVPEAVARSVDRTVGDRAAGQRDEAGLLGDAAEVEGAAADIDDAGTEQGVGLDERERAGGDVSPAGVAVDLRHRHRAARRLVDGGGAAGAVGDDGRDGAELEVVGCAGQVAVTDGAGLERDGADLLGETAEVEDAAIHRHDARGVEAVTVLQQQDAVVDERAAGVGVDAVEGGGTGPAQCQAGARAGEDRADFRRVEDRVGRGERRAGQDAREAERARDVPAVEDDGGRV